jgi:type IV pilus assembly protein PilM
MALPCAGVDISDTSLKFVALSGHTPGAYRLASWGDIDIPSGVVQRGEVLDAPKLSAVLREFKARSSLTYVRVSLPEERAYLFETRIKKNLSLEEVRNVLEFKLEENVPIPSRDVFFDYEIIQNDPDDRFVSVVVAAYARETIQLYYDACVAAGLFPLAFEVEAQAMARAVIPATSTGATMLVDFGKTRTGIGIVFQGVLFYTSTIDIGGAQLSALLRRELGDIPEAELTQIKNNRGLIRELDSSSVRDALLSVVSVIRDEIAARMQYWHRSSENHAKRRISTVLLCGGSANLKGLPEYLSTTLGVPCDLVNVWENTFSLETNVPPIDRRHSYGYATALGLALPRRL